jgi:hypothetical protein
MTISAWRVSTGVFAGGCRVAPAACTSWRVGDWVVRLFRDWSWRGVRNWLR